MNIHLKTALENARSERQKATEQLQEAEASLATIDIEIQGLELALARYEGKPPSAEPTPAVRRRWEKLHRTDAITDVLRDSDTPMSPREITDALHAVGRTDERHLVAAAIQYLKGEKRVHSRGYGQWVFGPPDDRGAS